MKRLVFPLFIFLLVFSPLAFGTVEPWSWAVVKSLALLSLLLLMIERRKNGAPPLHEVPGLTPLAFFLGYILLQVLPLPPFILKLVSPGTYDLYRETLWIADPGAWGSLSINPGTTVSWFLRATAMGAFYIVTIHVLAEKDLMRKTVGVVVVFVSALVFLSLLQHFLWNGKIYWLRQTGADAHPFGPYVNRNHYAGLVDMILPLTACLFIYYRPRYSCRSLRERVVEIFSNPLTNVHILLGFAVLLAATSVFLSLSKAGIMSLCISMIFFGAMVRSRGRGWVLIAFMVMLAFYAMGWFGWDQVFDRFEALRDAQGNLTETRLGIWKDTFAVIRDFPLSGTGLGTYAHIYPRYSSLQPGWTADHAHNDYMELLSDGGSVGVLLAAWFLWSVLRMSYAAFVLRRGRYSVLLFTGAVSGIVSILVCGLTDFNLHIGANALYFTFLTGLAVSAAHTSTRKDSTGTLLPKAGPVTRGLMLAGMAVLLLNTVFDAGGLAACAGLSALKGERLDARTPRDKLEEMKSVAHRASLLDPLSAGPHREAARVERLLSGGAQTLEHYRKAVRLDPVNGGHLQALGLALGRISGGDATEELLRSGIRCDRTNPSRYKTYALWLISSGRAKESAEPIRTAVALEPDKTREYVTLLVLQGWTDEEIRAVLPDMARPHILFAEYLQRTGNDVMAASEFRAAVEYGIKEKGVRPSDIHRAGQYFVKRGLFDDALAVMRRAAEALPADVEVKMILAEIYERTGIPYRAKEEYRKVLMIDPREDRAKRRLARMQ